MKSLLMTINRSTQEKSMLNNIIYQDYLAMPQFYKYLLPLILLYGWLTASGLESASGSQLWSHIRTI